MKNKTLIITFLIVVVLSCSLFESPNITAKESQDRTHDHISQNVITQRFGTDGLSPRWIERIAEIGDGCSGANDLRWEMFEPKPPGLSGHSYHWTKIDNGIRKVQTTGRKIQMTIRAFNRWAVEYNDQSLVHDAATGHKTGAFVRIKSKHLSDWAAFIKALVERYDCDGHNDMPGLKYPINLFQIGEEADNVWADAAGYSETVCTAYHASKSASLNAQIMVGGFNTSVFFNLSRKEQNRLIKNPVFEHKINFIKKFLATSEPCFDILTLHLNRGYMDIPPTVKWFQEVMAQNSYQKPIWSEDTSSGPFLSGIFATPEDKRNLKMLGQGATKTIEWFEKEQAKLLVKKAITAFASGVGRVFISTEVDYFDYYMPEWKHMGLLDASGRRKPAFFSFKTMVSKIDGFTAIERVSLATDVFAFRIKKPSQEIYVLWSEKERFIDLPIKSTKIKVTDISGSTMTTSPFRFHISTSPVFLEKI